MELSFEIILTAREFIGVVGITTALMALVWAVRTLK